MVTWPKRWLLCRTTDVIERENLCHWPLPSEFMCTFHRHYFRMNLKTCLLELYTYQTYGVSFASRCELVPFSFIGSGLYHIYSFNHWLSGYVVRKSVTRLFENFFTSVIVCRKKLVTSIYSCSLASWLFAAPAHDRNSSFEWSIHSTSLT